MQQFIDEIVKFILSIYTTIRTQFMANSSYWTTNFDNVVTKNIFTENSIIGLNFSIQELFCIIGVFTLVILFIVLFVKFVLKLVSIFRV